MFKVTRKGKTVTLRKGHIAVILGIYRAPLGYLNFNDIKRLVGGSYFYIEGIILDLKDIFFIEERKYKNMRVFLLTEEGRQFAKDLDAIIRKYKGEIGKKL